MPYIYYKYHNIDIYSDKNNLIFWKCQIFY